MLRLIRFLLFGDGHKHNWKFTHVTAFDGNIVEAQLICSVCGSHKSKTIYNCAALTVDGLTNNIKE